jgi:hypothetical protein
MKKYFIFFVATIFMFSCGNKSTQDKQGDAVDSTLQVKPENPMNREQKEIKEMAEKAKQHPQENPYKNSNMEVHTFKNQDNSWGYSVAIDGRTYINQPNIPPLPGNKGFHTSEEAKKTGEFVVYKIRNNIMPPSITVKELDSLQVLSK